MKRDCNLELRLVTPSVFWNSSDHINGRQYQSMSDVVDESPEEKQMQQLTIFYNGRVAVCDVTELQARAIILLASRKMDDKPTNTPGPDSISPLINSQLLYSPSTTGRLSMKKSLQRFFQKRKSRVEATSPYPVARHPK